MSGGDERRWKAGLKMEEDVVIICFLMMIYYWEHDKLIKVFYSDTDHKNSND